jgi:HNH endonuclease
MSAIRGKPVLSTRIPFKPCSGCGVPIARPEKGWDGRKRLRLCAACVAKVKVGAKRGVPQMQNRVWSKPCRRCGQMIPRPAAGWHGSGQGLQLCAACSSLANQGPRNHWWKGGRAEMTYDGYIRVWVAPGRPRQYEHRYVWEQAHGPIPAGYHVHHKNGHKTDNRLENLELVFGHTHLLQHGATRSLGGQWSRQRLACLNCHTTDHPHRARGLCTVCYNRVASALKCPRPCCQ